MTFPLELPPSNFIRFASSFLKPESSVLDIGCHTGRNSIFLAQMGHQVLGVTDSWADARGAVDSAQLAGVADRCSFVAGDARNLPVGGQADAVLINEVLHQMPKTQAYGVLDAARLRTRTGGLHLISGYVVDPSAVQLTRNNRAHCFSQCELADLYHGWEIVDYSEDAPMHRTFNGRQIVDSLARLVARKPD